MVNREPDFWRQFDILRPTDLEFPVHVVGCGGIGSPTALAMAKMGCKDMTLHDHDTVENHNLPNQIYRLADVGMAKVESLAKTIEDFTGVTPLTSLEQIAADSKLVGLVVSGVDSMAARKEIWQAIKYKTGITLYVDARMGAEVCRIYSIRPTNPVDVVMYEGTLYDDAEAQELPCTGRSIIYNVFMIAALVCSQVKKFARGQEFNKEVIFDLVTLMCLTE